MNSKYLDDRDKLDSLLEDKIPTGTISLVILSFTYQALKSSGKFMKLATDITSNIMEDVKTEVLNYIIDNKLSLDELLDITEYFIHSADHYRITLKKAYLDTVYSLLKLDNNELIQLPQCSCYTALLYIYRKGKEENKAFRYSFIDDDSFNINLITLLSDLLDIDITIKEANPLEYDSYEFDKALLMIDPDKHNHVLTNIEINNDALKLASDYSYFMIDKLLAKLKDNERIVAILLNRSLYRSNGKAYRDYLVSNHLIEGIISMVGSTLTNTFTETQVLVLSKNNEASKVIDSHKFLADNRASSFNASYVLDEYNSSSCKTLTAEKLLTKNNLLAEKLLLKEVEVKNPKLLKDVATIHQGTQYTLLNFKAQVTDSKTNYCLLTPSDIDEGLILWDNITYANIDTDKYDKHCVHKNDLIMTSKSTTNKIAVMYEEPKVKTIASGGMYIIRPDVNVINPFYLKAFLDSASGQIIIDSITSTGILHLISRKGLETITVPCPSIEEQNKFAEEYKKKLSEFIEIKEKKSILYNELNNFFDKDN